jgi:predicted CXXCH cytochrome family protein
MTTMQKIFPSIRIGLAIVLACLAGVPLARAAIDNSECFGCHGDENLVRSKTDGMSHRQTGEQLFIDEGKFSHSVHHDNGIGCVDCHADIEELAYQAEVPHKKQLEPVNCTICHPEESEAFTRSVHMKIRGKGITMNCNACHGSHYVTRQESLSVAERTNNVCAKCHNPYQSHDWLPKKNEHFSFVECVVCHVPETPRHIRLSFFDLMSNRFYSGQEILKILGISETEFMPMLDMNKDGVINVNEFENLELILRQKNVHAIFHAELVAGMHPGVHHVNRGVAERDCKTCHSANSPYFSAVTLMLSKGDGSADHFQVDRAVLESFSLRHFYALGGTRMKLLDKIGFLLLAGGVCVVAGHLAVRIATIPLRRKNRGAEKQVLAETEVTQ